MRTLYTLLPLTSDPALAAVTKFSTGDFNTTLLWQGQPLDQLPKSVRLFVDSSGGKRSDYLSNLLSWPIFSQRFLDIVLPLIREDVQLYPAPLFHLDSAEPIGG